MLLVTYVFAGEQMFGWDLPTTKAGEYAPKLMLSGRAAARPANMTEEYLTIFEKL